MTFSDPAPTPVPRSPLAQIELKDLTRTAEEPPGSQADEPPAPIPALGPEDDPQPGATRSTTPVMASQPAAARPWRRGGAIAGLLVLTALFASFLLSRCVGTSSTDKASSSAAASSGKDKAASGTTAADAALANRLANEPVIRIQPQRALAPVSSPLTLDVRGEGCAGRSGVLSILEVGSALRIGDTDRVVLRRRIDIDGVGKWQAAPLLVGQPPGSYEVVASCERRARAEGFPNPEDRRDVFTTTDILDLTGPFAASGFTLRPGLVEQDRQASIEVSGAGCRPNGSALSRVKGSVFGHGDARRGDGTGYQAPFEVDARSDGTWRTTITVPPEWARGSYGIQASCDGQVFATQSFHFVAGSQLAAPATAVAQSSGSVSGATPAQPVKAVPRFTG